MNKLAKYRVLLCGILSPLAALGTLRMFLSTETLTRFSKDLERDWLFRLSLATFGMILPFLLTFVLAWKDSRRHALSLSSKIGLIIDMPPAGRSGSQRRTASSAGSNQEISPCKTLLRRPLKLFTLMGKRSVWPTTAVT